MTALVVQGDACRLPLPNASVDLIVTSPPYYALRSYRDAGEHYDGQIGSEPTPAEYLEALWTCTTEWMRVLKPEGSMFVNLGDKYSGAQAQNYNDISNRRSDDSAAFWRRTDPKRTGIPNKSLMGIPWRYAIGCIDQLGLILRAEIIWSKPNGLPESVTDRVRRSHEQWFWFQQESGDAIGYPISHSAWFHFVKQSRYYSAVDEIREGYRDAEYSRNGHRQKTHSHSVIRTSTHYDMTEDMQPNPLGKLPGSVWSIPSEPLTVPDTVGVDHFAAFPTELPRRLILGWSPPGICTVCGQGRRPVSDKRQILDHHQTRSRPWVLDAHEPAGNSRGINGSGAKTNAEVTITGYACACPEPDAPTRPAVILDPFGGTGTTALVAHALGRVGITVDMSGDYSRLAKWRCTDRGELAKAMRVEKPPPVPDGQMEMFT